MRRGVAFAEDVRFCFTVFEDNEQEEAGDTLEHTWWKPSWPVCTTKWLYVWGSRLGEACVSTTAPFKYHNTGEEPVIHWALLFLEPWSEDIPSEIVMERVFYEPWGILEIEYIQAFYEPWSE